MSIEKRATAGSIAGLASLGLSMLQSLMLVPLLLSFWKAEVYGMWMGVAAAVALLISLDSGHQNYLGNLFNRLWIENRGSLIGTVRSGVRAAVGIACLELVIGIGLIASGNLSRFAGTRATGAGVAGALLINLVFWVLNGSIGGILVKIYAPAGLYAWSQWLGIAYRALGFLAVVASVVAGASLIGAMTAQVLAWTACNLFTFSDLRRRFPEAYPWWRGGDWGLAWQNFRASLILTVNGFIEQAGSNGLVLFVGQMLNPLSVALFTTLRTVTNLAIQGASIMLTPIMPDLVRYHVGKEGEKLSAVVCFSWIIGTTSVTAGLVLGIFVLEPLYAIWTRGVLPLDRLLFAFLGAAVAMRQWAAPFQTYLISLNRLRSQSAMAVSRAIFGLGLTGALMPVLGLSAAGLGALAAECGAAAIAALTVRRDLHGWGTAFPARSGVLALAQILVAIGSWLLAAHGAAGRVYWVPAAFLAIVALGFGQWKLLSAPLQHRLGGFFFSRGSPAGIP